MTEAKKELPDNVLIIKGPRMSFADIWVPKAFEGKSNDPTKKASLSYGCTLLLPKGDPQIDAIDKMFVKLATEKWGHDKKVPVATIVAGIRGQGNKCCILDGDTKAYDGYAGHMALRAIRNSESGPPKILRRDTSEVKQGEHGAPYSGCYVNAKVEFWVQDNSFGKAFRCTLNTLQFSKDGDAFSSTGPASADGMEAEPEDETESLV